MWARLSFGRNSAATIDSTLLLRAQHIRDFTSARLPAALSDFPCYTARPRSRIGPSSISGFIHNDRQFPVGLCFHSIVYFVPPLHCSSERSLLRYRPHPTSCGLPYPGGASLMGCIRDTVSSTCLLSQRLCASAGSEPPQSVDPRKATATFPALPRYHTRSGTLPLLMA